MFPLPSPQIDVGSLSHAYGKPLLSCLAQNTLAPLHSKWNGRAISSSAEVITQGIATSRAMDGHAPLGLVRHSYHPQGRPQMYSRRTTCLRLPGGFFVPQDMQNADPANYVTQLKDTIKTLRCTPTRRPLHSTRPDNSLSSATHVFVRHDAVRKPL